MSPANLKEPFNPSCCDGGACSTEQSTQSCGCDPGANYVSSNCWKHQPTSCGEGFAELVDEWAEKEVYNKMVSNDWIQQGLLEGPVSDKFTPYPKSEVRMVDAATGGEKGVKIDRYDLIPPEVEDALATHYGVGARKYADRNWERGYKWGYSYRALRSHLNRWLRGETFDDETGTHHLICVIWHAIALYIFDIRNLGTNDLTRKKDI